MIIIKSKKTRVFEGEEPKYALVVFLSRRFRRDRRPTHGSGRGTEPEVRLRPGTGHLPPVHRPGHGFGENPSERGKQRFVGSIWVCLFLVLFGSSLFLGLGLFFSVILKGRTPRGEESHQFGGSGVPYKGDTHFSEGHLASRW